MRTDTQRLATSCTLVLSVIVQTHSVDHREFRFMVLLWICPIRHCVIHLLFFQGVLHLAGQSLVCGFMKGWFLPLWMTKQGRAHSNEDGDIYFETQFQNEISISTMLWRFFNIPWLTVRFIKFRNFFSISVIMEKSPFGRFSLTVVTFSWGQREIKSKDKQKK